MCNTMLPDVACNDGSPLILTKCIDNLHELHGSVSSDLQSITIDDLLFNESFGSLPPPPADADLDHSVVRKNTRRSNNRSFEKALQEDTFIQRCYLNDLLEVPTDAHYDLTTTSTTDSSLYPRILQLLLATASDVDRPLNHSCSSIGSDDIHCGDDSIVITKRRILKGTKQDES
jgi:hypothetical protein